jgi:hypothetical protein
MIIAAVIFSQGRWASRRRPDIRPSTGMPKAVDQPQSPGPTLCAHGRQSMPWRPVRWRTRCRIVFSTLGRIIGGRIQPVCVMISASLSDGVIYPSVLRGQSLRLRAMRVRSAAECTDRSVPLGASVFVKPWWGWGSVVRGATVPDST